MQTIGLVLLAYLWGSLSPSFLVARWRKGIDLREYGSGNVGGSNVGEQLGQAWTIGVGFLDLLKGALPVFLVRMMGLDVLTQVLVGIATVIGHNWPFYLGFKGGRGLGPTVGVMIAWDVRLAIILLAFFGIGRLLDQGAPMSLIGLVFLVPAGGLLGDIAEIVLACASLALVIAIKRLEANRLPLPADARQRRLVLLRRLWMDRDVPRDQPWQERRRIE